MLEQYSVVQCGQEVPRQQNAISERSFRALIEHRANLFPLRQACWCDEDTGPLRASHLACKNRSSDRFLVRCAGTKRTVEIRHPMYTPKKDYTALQDMSTLIAHSVSPEERDHCEDHCAHCRVMRCSTAAAAAGPCYHQRL